MTKHDQLPETQPGPSQPPEYQPPSQPQQISQQELSQQEPSQQERDQQITPNPPPYKTATSTLPPTTTHHFTRRHIWTSKVQVETSGVARYTFTPGPKSAVWLHAGASTSNKALGYLTFPQSHNAFRLWFRRAEGAAGGGGGTGETTSQEDEGFVLSDVKARVGVPHVSTFTFKSNPSISPRAREYEWANKTPSGSSGPVRYVLSAYGAAGWKELATLVVAVSGRWKCKGKGKDGTYLRWRRAPESELEQAFLILSAVGVVTRLSRKGMFREGGTTAGQRWFAFWWVAALSSAAVM